jgi:outer membrane protein assembly factor BamB
MADGKVLAATAGAGGPGSRGKLYALDQETGDILWSFDTIESDDLWGHPEINSGGGTWYPPSVDIANRVAYWGISNPYPSRERSAIPPVQAGQETTNGPTQFSTSTPAS